MNNLLLLEEAAPQAGAGGMLATILPFVLMIVVFYFFLIRPQKKQERETANMRNNLQVGDEVTTIGGIVGRITHVKDDIVTIETGADRNKIRFRKTAIATVDKKYGEEKAPKGGYKVTGVKKSETPIEAPALKEDVKEEK
ncbi:MAG: preprotein translocase subunit YajC [Clostridia bacterium]|nr:preprotein translocase subunit YajC [Clostridia bacterium]